MQDQAIVLVIPHGHNGSMKIGRMRGNDRLARPFRASGRGGRCGLKAACATPGHRLTLMDTPVIYLEAAIDPFAHLGHAKKTTTMPTASSRRLTEAARSITQSRITID